MPRSCIILKNIERFLKAYSYITFKKGDFMRLKVVGILISLRFLLVFILTLFFSLLVNASIITESINPVSIVMCGGFQKEQLLTAINISNTGGNITTLKAELVIPSSSALSITTQNPIIIGSILANQTISTNLSWLVECSPGNKGSYTAFINFLQNNTVISSTKEVKEFLINVDPEPLEIITSSPRGYTNKPQLSLTTNAEATCKFDTLNKAFENMNNTFSTTGGTTHLQTLTLEDGFYTYFVQCQDISGVQLTPPERLDFTLDTKAPSIVSYEPKGVLKSKFANLNITLDEESVCTYESEFGSKKLRRLSNNKYAIDVVMKNKEQTVVVKCKDLAGNNAQDYEIFLLLVEGPTAKIETLPASPFKPGLIEVKLKTSKELPFPPTLKYKINDVEEDVLLEGEGTLWEGVFLTGDVKKETIGSFNFTAKDNYGIEGSSITEGGIFIIDPVPPNSPSNLVIKKTKKGNILSWEAPSEKISKYIIYRSESSNVKLSDRYGTTEKTEYLDKNADISKNYYYAVSAVDLAGNFGPLSSIVSSEDGGLIVQTKTPTSEKTLDDLKQLTDKIKTDVKEIRKELRNSSFEESKVLDLINILRTAEVEVIQAEEEIKELKETNNTAIFEKKKAELVEKLDRLKSVIPKKLKILNTRIFFNSLSASDVKKVLKNLFSELDEEKLDEEAENLVSKYKSLAIETTIKLVEVEYYDGNKKEFTLVEKKSKERIRETIVEYIPKEVAKDVSELTLRNAKILRKDPILEFDTLEGWSYAVNRHLSTNESKKLKSIVVDVNKLSSKLKKKESKNNTFFSFKSTVGAVITSIDSNNYASPSIIGVALIILILGMLTYFLSYNGTGIPTGYSRYNKYVIKEPSKRKRKKSFLSKKKTSKNLLDLAHENIDLLKYGKARRIYERLHLNPEGFNSKKLKNLHNKLLVYTVLKDLQYAVKKRHVKEIDMLTKKLVVLAKKVKINSNTKLSNQLNFYKNLLIRRR